MLETTPNKCNKETFPSLWVTNDISRDLTVLYSVNFHLKKTIHLIVGRKMGYKLKRSFSRNIILSGKLNVKMTPSVIGLKSFQ